MAGSKGKAPVLTLQGDDFPRWYQDVVAKAELADNGPVRGTMVIRPYAYALWERMQAEVDDRIKAAGAENAYFPLFIPQAYFQREAEHVHALEDRRDSEFQHPDQPGGHEQPRALAGVPARRHRDRHRDHR